MNLIEEFKIQYGLDYSKDTMVNYTSDIKQFLEYASSILGTLNDIDTMKKVDWSLCNGYRKVLHDKGLSSFSINRKLSAISTLFKLCIDLKIVNENLMSDGKVKRLRTNKLEQHNDFISEDEFKKLYYAIESPQKGDKCIEFTVTRDLLLYTLMITCGSRIAETLSIKLDDIDFDSKVIHVIGKGNKRRKLPFDDKIVQLYNDYIIERDKVINACGKNDEGYLFISYRGQQLTPRASNKNLKKYCERANIKDVSNHVLRHTFATIQVSRGTHINTISTILGHSSVNTTSRYTHTNDEMLHANIGANI